METGTKKYVNLRKSMIETLTKLARGDPKVILIIADVGFSFIEDYQLEFPKQFINVGVMEQTMMGVAAGLARVGWKPYVYTMKNFILLRPMEQLRNDICYPKLNIKLLAVGGSTSYRFLGYSHNMYDGQEEKLLSSLPYLKSYAPETEEECKEIVEETYKNKELAYIAL